MKKIEKNGFVLATLITVIFLSGLCQGMLLPLLSILLEARGVSATLNGVNASALYLGILAAAPFMEKTLYRFGFKPLLLVGTLIVALQMLVFPLMQSYGIWLGLRFSIGLFNHIFHYATIVWLGLIAPAEKRGRYISYYGFSFGLGFSLGPLLAGLHTISIYAPFLFMSGLGFSNSVLVCFLETKQMENSNTKTSDNTLSKRVKQVFVLAWFALLPTVGYGFLESSMSGSLPVFLTRNALEGPAISLVLTAFFLSGLVAQLPLGRMSDYLGRRKTLILLLTIGISSFLGASLVTPGNLGMTIFYYAIAGGAMGSMYSLSVAFVLDCIPKVLLPTANMLCSVCFGIGSLLGPFVGGLYIHHFPENNFAWLLLVVFSMILTGLALGKPQRVLL